MSNDYYHIFKKPVKSKNRIVHRYYYYYIDDFTGKKIQKVCKDCKTSAEAYAFISKLPQRGTNVSLPIREIAKEMFIPGCEHIKRLNQLGKKMAPRTISNNRGFVKLIIEQFGDYRLEDLTIPMVSNYLMSIEDRSGSWKNSFLETLGAIYKEAPWHCNCVINKPDFPRFARNSKKADIFTQEELIRFFDGANWIDGLREYLIFLVMASCGLRLGEARGLRVKQFIPESHALIIDGFCDRDGNRTNYNKKGSDEDQKLRVTLVPDDTMNLIKSYISSHYLTENDFVFQRDNGTPLRQEFLESVFHRVLIKSGIDSTDRKLCPHSFRFTYVTRMRRKVDAETVQKMVGHSSVEMTEYYTRAAIPEMVRSIQNVLPAVNGLFE